MKELFARDRPEVVPDFVAVNSSSFPSGHSVLVSATHLTLRRVAGPLRCAPAGDSARALAASWRRRLRSPFLRNRKKAARAAQSSGARLGSARSAELPN